MKIWLHHININGADAQEMDRFYADVMHQSEIPLDGKSGLPALDDTSVRVPVAFRTDGAIQFHLAEPDPDCAKRHGKTINPLTRGHIAYRTDDIEEFKAHLTAKGIPFDDYGTVFTKGWHQVFFLDPAGTIIEVHQVLDESG
ncbi:MAG: VOC family protein [Pseudomonadota bacterium]